MAIREPLTISAARHPPRHVHNPYIRCRIINPRNRKLTNRPRYTAYGCFGAGQKVEAGQSMIHHAWSVVATDPGPVGTILLVALAAVAIWLLLPEGFLLP